MFWLDKVCIVQNRIVVSPTFWLDKVCIDQNRIADGRFPTFWMENECIDQNRIGAGLRVLPVNVMACYSNLLQ